MKTFTPLCIHPKGIKQLYAAGATYKHPALKNIPDISAVYVLQHPDGTFYVGSSKKLKSRLCTWARIHPESKFNYIPTPPQDRVMVEDRIMKTLIKRGINCQNINSPRLTRRPPRPLIDPKSLRQQCFRAGINYEAAQARVRAGRPFNKKRPLYKQWVTINGRTRPPVFWARWYKIPLVNILMRRQRGWEWEVAIKTPIKKGR